MRTTPAATSRIVSAPLQPPATESPVSGAALGAFARILSWGRMAGAQSAPVGRGLVAFLLSLAGGSAGSPEPGLVIRPDAVGIPPSYFSMNILFHPLTRVPWPSVPLGGWRLSHVNWADIQPAKHQWNFDLLDRYSAWSQAHRLEILMPLTYAPRWASSTPDAPTDVENGNPPGLSGAPRDMEDWRIYVRTVASRYKGRIHDWEIWNEPNRPKSWTGSVDTLVEMTCEASRILKETDPGNMVVSPAPTGSYGLSFFNRFLARGGGKCVDVIGYHFYLAASDPPEKVLPLISAVRSGMKAYGVDEKPLWNTESGWLGGDPLAPGLAAAYVARAYLLAWAAGVTRFYWYAWEIHDRTSIELTGPDNATLTPAGTAFSVVQRWMTGQIMTRCGRSEGTWTCDFRKGTAATHIVWSTDGTRPFAIPDAWHARTVSQLNGDRSLLDRGVVDVGAGPVMIQ
jgi:hypothetical protein